jgi:beta-1,4-mannosyltransferase
MRLRLMASPGRSTDNDNPYASMLRTELERHDEVISFSWWRAVGGRYDILHVQWPELIVAHPNSVLATAKKLAFCGIILLNRIRRIPMVATVHNLAPHSSVSPFAKAVTRFWYQNCAVRIYLTQSGASAAAFGPGVHIQHGDYVPFVTDFLECEVESVPNLLLNFGHVKRYKGIETVIAAVSAPTDFRLLVAGNCSSSSYAAELEALAKDSPSVTLDLRPLGSAELVGLIRSARAVVLPYAEIYNSGAALMALTLSTPIVVTASDSMRELQAEVGTEWVQLLPDRWSLADLEKAVRGLASERASRPMLKNRTWSEVGTAHHNAYVLAYQNGRCEPT